ncbi:MAG: mechanosensitive ion channel family protein [Geobacteraceae bacterium]|nr:mechanosensitive ion channel family protein [Geobacteraceae bacterium]
MEMLTEFLQTVSWQTLVLTSFRILIILLLGWFLGVVIEKVLKKLERRLVKKGEDDGEPPTESTKRAETLVRLIRQGVYLAIWITIGLVILQEIGVDIGPILAGAGILGLAVGFGGQNLVRDVISGFFIILENQVRVGDVAIINGTGGLVEKVNFRTIVLRDLAGVVHIFPNGTITTLSNMTQEWSAYVFEIGVAYKENTDVVTRVLGQVLGDLCKDPTHGELILEEPEIYGVNKLDDSAVVIKGRIKTKPSRQWQVGREFLRRVKLAFDEQGIEIPFPHSTVYFGEVSKPFDVRLLERLQNEPLTKEG